MIDCCVLYCARITRITDVILQVPEHVLDEKIDLLNLAMTGKELEILRWYDIAPHVKDAQTLDTSFVWIFQGIVAAMIFSGIASTILVSIIQDEAEN